MARLLQANRLLLFVLALAGLCAASSVVIVGEGEQVVIERLGKPVRVVNRFRTDGTSGAGVVLKLPFIEQTVSLARGLQGYSLGGQKVRSVDAQDLLVDADLTYRIIDPVRLANRLGSAERMEAELGTILPALLGDQLDRLPAATIALPGNGGAAPALRSAIDAKARSFGVQVIDLRIGRVMPGDAALQMTYEIMQARHLREVDAIAETQVSDSHQTRAAVAAETGAILQASAGIDPEFYDFFRALRSYAIVFEVPNPKNPPTIVIPPGSAYLRHFNGQ
ncbi:MAG: SPFH domain-containing protein [Novosphingobium sp.]|uniref:SPFH domain-containing protein n=1 Tax=Novosphingobium sp. TaxID=1874826 RepID=UPI0032BED00B